MEFKGKYKEWYDRLVKADYGKELAKAKIEKFIIADGDEYWDKMFLERIEKFKEKPNEAKFKVDRIRELTVGFDRWEKAVQVAEEERKFELELLKKAIPKNDLEDGAWYDCEKEAKKVARFQGKAQWVKEKNMFLAPGQQQFGADGWLNHWADVVNGKYAGFVPMWKVEND